MKHLLLTTIAAVLVVGCGESQQSAPAPESKPAEPVAEAAKPEPPKAKAPDISIHEAVRTGNIEAVKQHLAAGTDVNTKNRMGSTPLHFSAQHAAIHIVKLLIANGADVNLKNVSGKTPLDSTRNPKIADLLRKHGGVRENWGLISQKTRRPPPNPFRRQLVRPGGKTGEELEGGEPVAEAATPEPTTARALGMSIHDAALLGFIGTIKKHLDAGTDVNAKDTTDETPLHFATFNGHKEIAELLIDKGADVNAKNGGGGTPLHSAAKKGHKEIVELLIAEGADVNATNNSGDTPLDWAIQVRNTKIADSLRKHGGKTGEELKAEGK